MGKFLLKILALTLVMTAVLLAREYNYPSSHYKYISVFEKEGKSQKIDRAPQIIAEIEEEIEKWSWGSEKALNCMLTIFILTLIIIFFSFKEFLKLKLTNWVIIFSLSILFTAWVRIMIRRNEKT